jgi:hypothetical protein
VLNFELSYTLRNHSRCDNPNTFFHTHTRFHTHTHTHTLPRDHSRADAGGGVRSSYADISAPVGTVPVGLNGSLSYEW